jgi:uncharacterized protein (UPF0332 family)
MGLRDTDRETLVKMYWERCEEAFTDADAAIASERWNNAANRIYYAVFYAVCSLFVKDGHPIKSHRGAKNILGLNYVVTGKIDPETSKIFSQLETLRDLADYDVAFLATKEEVMDYRPKADAFIAAVKGLMKE